MLNGFVRCRTLAVLTEPLRQKLEHRVKKIGFLDYKPTMKKKPLPLYRANQVRELYRIAIQEKAGKRTLIDFKYRDTGKTPRQRKHNYRSWHFINY